MFNNSSILVTGGTGSVGNTFVNMTLKKYNPKRIIIYSRDEMKQWEMSLKYENDNRVKFVIGDVRDKDRLKSNFIGINNRNLKTLKVNINNTKKLIKKIPKNKYVISESGIKTVEDMIDLWSYGIKGFLIGETLLKNPSKLKDFLNVKTN